MLKRNSVLVKQCGVYDSVVMEKRGGPGYDESSDTSSEEDSPIQMTTPVDASMKYWEQVARIALCLHCINDVMGQMLQHSPQIQMNTVVKLESVKRAKLLVDHIVQQTREYVEEMDATPDDSAASSAKEKSQNVSEGLCKRLLEERGPLVPCRQIIQSKINGVCATAGQAEEACRLAESENLGTLQNIRTTPGKRKMKIFFKNTPTEVDPSKLKMYGVSSERYKQQFDLPLSSTCVAGKRALAFHPHRAVLTTYQQTNADVNIDEHSDGDEVRELPQFNAPTCTTATEREKLCDGDEVRELPQFNAPTCTTATEREKLCVEDKKSTHEEDTCLDKVEDLPGPSGQGAAFVSEEAAEDYV